MVNIALGDIFGEYTGHDAKQLEDQFHGSPLQTRNVVRFVSGIAQETQEFLNSALKNADAERLERFDLLDDQAIALNEEARKVRIRLKNGRIKAAEGRKELARIGTSLRELRERAEQLKHDDASLKEMAEQDPADYQKHLLDTYPALRQGGRLPVFTPDMLNDQR